MAFGKKKEKELERAVQAAAAELPSVTSSPDDVVGDVQDVVLDETIEVAEEPVPPEPAAETDAASGDALLSMFETGELETADLSVVVALAGDVDLDDLLEELQIVAAALGIAAAAETARAA